MGSVPGEKEEENAAELVRIALHVERLAAELLWAGPPGCESGSHRDGVLAFAGFFLLVEEPGDAKVDELGSAVSGDEDVAGLEVAVDDEVAVGVGNAVTDALKDVELDGQSWLRVSEPGLEIGGVEEFGDDVGKAFGGDATIKEAQNVLVGEAREDLALHAEAAAEVMLVARETDQLERDGECGSVHLLGGFIDATHAAIGDEAIDPIFANPAAFKTVHVAGELDGRFFEKVIGLIEAGE